MEVEHDRLLRVVMMVLAGSAAFFGIWTYVDSISPMPPMEAVGPHGLALLLRVGIATPTAAAAVGLAFFVARFCWPVRPGSKGRASDAAQ